MWDHAYHDEEGSRGLWAERVPLQVQPGKTPAKPCHFVGLQHILPLPERSGEGGVLLSGYSFLRPGPNDVSSSASPPRFRIRLEDGSEIAVSSVEALARRVGRGDLLPDTPLFDASIGQRPSRF
jgi:hypothetical protein